MFNTYQRVFFFVCLSPTSFMSSVCAPQQSMEVREQLAEISVLSFHQMGLRD